MRTLLIRNNFFLVSELRDQFDRFIFSPVFYSNNQKAFYERRFQELKKIIPTLQWTQDEVSGGVSVLAWDAFEEKKLFGEQLLPRQNRLFSRLPFSLPEVFTPFREKAEPLLPSYFPEAIAPYDEEVLRHLKRYFWENKRASTYFETRNALVGDDFSTRLSSFLSCGALDVRYLYNEVKRYEEKFGANKSTYWIIFELLWREYFYWHYQKHQTAYFSETGLLGPKDFSPLENIGIAELYERETHPFFKAALNELRATGFLSNRTRQMFASYWLNDLGLPWRSGAKLFEEELLDYDVYSNYGNWMYLAGVGVDPRGKRYFKIDKQLQAYDPEENYLKYFS